MNVKAMEGLPTEFLNFKKILSQSNDLEISQILIEKESAEYGACSFVLNKKNIRFRSAKITPTKTGQFVTLWKRINQGPIQPFDNSDPIDLFIISVRKNDSFGLFAFPKAVLIEKGIVSEKKEGKRAIRVYPAWDLTTNKQAQKTQKWQLDYFVEIPLNETIDLDRIKLLLDLKY
ncbi:MepB family protein [Flavobacterium sp.]|uniref:MepB family protein n=1 Tax=Flavobacterium sp. TaxID=239 RepID=UPI002C5A7FBF|nr:MepB family protein [Flavobacterium sp.]HSD07477.1 MepB family protein [Flavobacterium sp.]